MKRIVLLLILTLLCGCKEDQFCGLNFNLENFSEFNFPTIDTTGQLSTAYIFNRSEIDSSADLIDFDFEKKKCKTQVHVYVDNTIELKAKYHSPYVEINVDLIDTNGALVKSPYYPPHDTLAMLPCIIYNCTDQTQFLVGSDGKLIAIQEALNRDGKWYPIEKFKFSGCGNSYHKFPVRPNSFTVVPIYKYSGNFETKIRLKIEFEDSVYYSNEYLGKINEEQTTPCELDFDESYLGNKTGY